MDELIQTYKKKNKIIDEENFDNNDYKPFITYGLNNCVYVFNNIFKGKDNNFYNFINGKYKLIKPKFINDIKYISIDDVNKNKIKIIIK